MAVKDLFDKDDDSEQEEDASEAAEKKAEISVSKRQLKKMLKGEKPKKETKAQRQKPRQLEKIKKREKETEKKIRIQQNEIYRLKSILKEVNTEVKVKEEELLKREVEAKHRELFDTKRLNSLRYEEPELEVKLSDEITGNLRTLKVSLGQCQTTGHSPFLTTHSKFWSIDHSRKETSCLTATRACKSGTLLSRARD